MSIILAIISSRDGIVASDGRTSTPVRLVNNIPIESSVIESDNFNKTFLLDGGRIVGAFCGLVQFSGATIAEHILDITNGRFVSTSNTFSDIVDLITDQLTIRLDQIDDTDIIPSSRCIDLLLVGGSQLKQRDIEIVALRFTGSSEGVSHIKETLPASNQCLRYFAYGDNCARASVAERMSGNYSSSQDAKFLKKLATEAIDIGIRSSGNTRYGNYPSCGGTIFTERTWY